jgi:hypothetical protein
MIAILATWLLASAAAAEQDRCQARLEVKLTPDVPNPRDPSFLSALAASPLYELTWVSSTDETVVLNLKGPATDYQCQQEINRIGRDTHILDLKVVPASGPPGEG